MTAPWPHAWGAPAGSAVIRSCPEDFQVREELGFDEDPASAVCRHAI